MPPPNRTVATAPVASPATPPAPAKPPAARPLPAAGAKAKAPPKVFAVQSWSQTKEGEKTLIYASTGKGKTTLAALLPEAVFLGLDDGGRKIKNPKTGADLQVVGGVATYQDMRDAINQRNLWTGAKHIVIDTITKAETFMEPYICENNPLKGGARATSMRAFGWDGPSHLVECLRLLESDLDYYVRQGISVTVLAQQAQVRVPNSAGMDFLEDGPKLQHNNQYSSRMELCEWCDHVLRIGYLSFEVTGDTEKNKAGKVNAGDQTRAVFSNGAAHFVAKTRPIDGKRLPAVISFADATDDSLWQYMFNGAIPEVAT